MPLEYTAAAGAARDVGALHPKEFDTAWHALGYQYGEDALSNVRVGWNLSITYFKFSDHATELATLRGRNTILEAQLTAIRSAIADAK